MKTGEDNCHRKFEKDGWLLGGRMPKLEVSSRLTLVQGFWLKNFSSLHDMKG